MIAVIIIIILIAVDALNEGSQKNRPSSAPYSSAGILQTPISNPLIQIESPNPQYLNVVKTDPENNVLKSVWSVEPVVIYFDEEINFSSVNVTSEPNPGVRYDVFNNNPKALSIFPFNGWDANVTYTITLSRQTRSKAGKPLAKDYTFTFKRLIPHPGDPEYPDVPLDEAEGI